MHRPLTSLHLAAVAAFAVAAVEAARPAFVEQSFEPSGLALVESVTAGTHQDLVVLQGGLNAGFRGGMLANVERDGESIGRLIIADATADRAVALILELEAKQTIQPADRVLRSLISLR